MSDRKRGGQPGNDNQYRGRIWRQAILNALKKRSPSGKMAALEQIADKLIEQALDGDNFCLKELGDRLEGKATQFISADDPATPVKFDLSGLSDKELDLLQSFAERTNMAIDTTDDDEQA